MSSFTETEVSSTTAPSCGWMSRNVLWLLLVIIGIGVAARFYNQDWDQHAGQHPDERHVMMCTWRLDWPSSIAEYFDEAHSPLNPRNRDAHFYAYGTLPGTMLRAVMKLGGIKTPEQMVSTARVLSALADIAVIGLVFGLAWTLYRQANLALLAALFYALAVLPIQQAHFFVVDPFANMFVALALFFLARAWRAGTFSNYILTGFALGLAVSCKISVATFGLPVALVSLIPSTGVRRSWMTALVLGVLRTLLFSVVAIVMVRIALPDAFIGFWPWQLAPRWLANMREVVAMSTGAVDVVFTRQFYHRIPLLWPGWNLVAWGLGLALGVTAWLGWATAFWQIVRRRVWAHAVPVLWIAVVFFHLGFTYQSTMRYFLPIYGSLCVLAAWWLIRISTSPALTNILVRETTSRRVLGKLTAGLVIGFTFFWALAFLSIYTQPHTRIEASRWIYENIPRGKVLACEHWDDWLPLSLGPDARPDFYKQIELPLYEVDDGGKRGILLARLNNADYIIVASQKLRDSIPRMPHRYPFTISYYEGLEDGSLGFDRVAEFTRPMNFLGIKISTRSAEEAFSVYDHPPVVIYKKTSRYNPEALVKRFNSISLAGVTNTRDPEKPQPASLRKGGKRTKEVGGKPESAILLSDARRAQMDQEGTWSEIFDRQSFAAKSPVVVWTLLLLVLQVLGWALLGPIFRMLPDRGIGLTRPFALLLSCWLLWFLASTGVAHNERSTYWIILFGMFAGAVVSFWKNRSDWRGWWQLKGWKSALRVEAVFWIAFAFFLIVRSYNPDLWHAFWGGEKPMEMTYLYGVIKSSTFPPLNPWYAGGFINYYYFGFVLCGTLIKSVGVLPEVGFNLCLATFFGLACAATMTAARALRPGGRWWPVWTATAFVMVCGNLFQIRFIWRRLLTLGQSDHQLTFPIISDLIRATHGVIHLFHGESLSAYKADLYWVAARAISSTDVPPVTEFPYWSFLYGDLHPHLIALSYTICVIALLVTWIRSSGVKIKLGLSLLLGLTLGFFWPTNTWDWPTYSALTGLILFITFWQRDHASLSGFVRSMAKSIAVFLAILGFGYLAFLPFHRAYVAGYGSFRLWDGSRTSLLDYLFIFGLFLFILGSSLVEAWQRREFAFARGIRLWMEVLATFFNSRNGTARRRLLRLGFSRPSSFIGVATWLVFLILAALVLFQASLPALLVGGIILACFAVWYRRYEPIRALPALLVLIAFGLSLVVEFVVLVGDVGRMNTVFKFYYQIWVCFGLASALALPGLLQELKTWRARIRLPWLVVLFSLILAASLYPLLGTPAKIHDRFAVIPPTLDGLAFAEKAEYSLEEKKFSLAPDLHAIRWLQDHISGSPVLLEMNTGVRLYSWGSRYSIHTGLPTVVGWGWHQRQQQAGLEHSLVETRIEDVRQIYQTPDLETARALITRYRVGLIVVGEVERIYGTPEGIAKFAHMGYDKIYDQEGVQIYRVPVGPL